MGMKKIIQINNNEKKEDKSNVSFKKFDKKEKKENVELTEDIIYGALKNVNDPELPVSIVDLGLIYDTQISGNNVSIKMTLTTPGCSMGAHIAGQAEEELKKAGANNVIIEVVWDPPWNPDMMSDEAKSRLGM